MENTYLDYFNYYLKQFLNELISYFPQTKQSILNNYRTLLEDTEPKSDLFVKYYMSKVNDYLTPISQRDVKLFENTNLYLLEGVDFNKIWNSSESNSQNQNAIWKYIQLLVLLGRRIIPNKKDILNMLQKVGNTIDTPEKIENTLDSKETADLGENSNGGGLASLLGGLGGLGGLGSGLGGLGNLLGGSGGGGLGDISQLAQGLGDMMKNLNIDELAQNMSQQVSENTSENTSENASENASEETENTSNRENGGNDEASGNTEQSNGLFNSSLFTDLAKEMTDTFDFSEQEQPQNIGDAFKTFMSGDNASKLMNLVGKFGNRLQNDIAKGNINQQELMRETTQMMGGMGNLQQMAQQMAANNGNQAPTAEMMQNAVAAMGGNRAAQNRVRTANRNQVARERLRAKVEARKNNKNN